jgi:hypothetical protein
MRNLSGILLVLVGISFVRAEPPTFPLQGLVSGVSPDQFVTESLGHKQLDGHSHLVVRAQTKTWALADRLGYCEIRAWYDTEDHVMRLLELIDQNHIVRTSIRFKEFFNVGNKLQAGRVEIHDHINNKTRVIEAEDPKNPKTML